MLYQRLPLLLGGLLVKVFDVAMIVTQIKAEMGLCARTGDLEWNFSSRSVLMEKGIHRFQQDGLPAGRHLRQLGIGLQESVEVKHRAIEAVFPTHICMGSRNLKVEHRKRQHSILQQEPALQVG